MTVNNHQTSKNSITIWIKNQFNDSALIRSVFLFVAWLGVWQVGRLVEYTEHASVWFPAAGFTFSCLLVLGLRAFLSIMFAAIIITVWQGNHYQVPLTFYELIWAGFLFGLAHIIPYWAGASVIGKLAQSDERNSPRLIVSFLIVAGITTLIATILVISSLVYTNLITVEEVSKTLLPFWIGDMAGVVVLTPLFSSLLIWMFPNPNIDLQEFTEEGLGSFMSLLNKLGLNVILIIMTMLLAYVSETQESSFAIFFLAVTHMWIACTESPVFNIVSLAISSFLIVLLVHILGLMDHVMVYQFAINVIAANALFGIAVPQLKAYNKELEHMVFTDALTKVSSRHFMVQTAEHEIQKCHSKNLDLSMVVFDLDNFKLINDKYGHSLGDEALKEACNVTKKMLKDDVIFARFGGDEFVLLLPGFDREMAHQLVSRIKKAISAIKIGDNQLSSSFGIAQLRPNEDFALIFHRADNALYQSKQSGGNQISLSKVV